MDIEIIKFKEFLEEGVVKTPPKLRKQIINFVLNASLSAIKNKIEG